MKIKESISGIVKYGQQFRESNNKKKWIVLIIGVGVIFLFMNLTSKKSPSTQPQSRNSNFRSQNEAILQKKQDASMAQSFVTPGTKVNNEDIWMIEGQKKINEVKQVSDQNVSQINQQESNISNQQQQIDQLNQHLDSLVTTINSQNQIITSLKGNASDAVKNKSNSLSGSQIQEIDMDSGDDSNVNSTVQSTPNTSPLLPSPTTLSPPQEQSFKEREKVKDVSEYIPSNTFVQGNLIEGISANTGGNSNSDPTPVLIRLTNLAQLPNFFRANVKNCMVGGSGYGDLSTERVKIRLDKLSCVMRNGNVIDIPVKGHVSGEDGKAGIRGVVVSHTGSALAKAALAGGLASLGTAAQTATQTQQVSPIGITNTINPNQAFGSAAAGGAAGGFNTLSQYYTNMLNQITPSIEVSSGRNVTVVFQEGITLKVKLGDTVNDQSPLPFNALDQ